MCLILLAYKASPQFPLILLANRDEFYNRPSRAAGIWPENPDILAGKDLRGGGTWLGISQSGRLAAITNFREPPVTPAPKNNTAAPSRGELTLNFLSASIPGEEYLQELTEQASSYAGFNLLIDDGQQLFYYSNRNQKIEPLSAGIYGLSNHLINTPWPKVAQGCEDLRQALNNPCAENLWPVLQNQDQPADHQLPDTGVGLEIERMLAPRFIHSADYGTRASTVILRDYHGDTRFLERNFDHGGEINTVNEIRFS